MRAFIAIDLPDAIKEELSRIQEGIKEKTKEDAKLKFVEAENLHLTLRFLGEISAVQVNRAKEALKSIHFEKFTAQLSNAGVFPSPVYIRVVWIGLEPADKIKELQEKIESILAKAGFEKEKRFESHVTAARVKTIKNKELFIKTLNAINVKPIEFPIDSFILKKSTLTREGPIYEDIVKFKLV